MREKYLTEYRINKKGAECFRSRDYQAAFEKLSQLNAKRPVYTIEARSARLNRYGDPELNWKGEIAWSIWR